MVGFDSRDDLNRGEHYFYLDELKEKRHFVEQALKLVERGTKEYTKLARSLIIIHTKIKEME